MVLFMDNPSAEALSSGFIFLRILSPFYFVVSTKLVADGILRGAGLMKQCATRILLPAAVLFVYCD